MKKSLLTIYFFLFCSLFCMADEGMWMLGNLSKETRQSMKELGLQLSASQLYNTHGTSLKDCVVSFGGFCSGVVVSPDGLVFTNHHCGFHSVQQLSDINHNYVDYGFAAYEQSGEIPCPELYVRFMLRQQNVTKRVLASVTSNMDEAERSSKIDSVMLAIGNEISVKDSTLVGIVDSYYSGTEFWLSVYRDYNDIRLVFAPPSFIGKFGWDTDNWEWPRHTGDFCVFRIYACKNNEPANYSPDNVPYHPSNYAPLSLDGYQEGDFSMTIGYPGETERYLSSYGIQEMMTTANQPLIDIRGVKLALLKEAMNHNDSIHLKYASKYDESSNYWKNNIGMNHSINRLHIIEKKQLEEKLLLQYLRSHPSENDYSLQLFTDLEMAYRQLHEDVRARTYLYEAFLNGPELLTQTLNILNIDWNTDDLEALKRSVCKILDAYKNIDLSIDKQLLQSMILTYKKHVDPKYLPDFYTTIDTLYQGNVIAFTDSLYAHTFLTSDSAIRRICAQDSTYLIEQDPAVTIALDVISKLFELNTQSATSSKQVEQLERAYTLLRRRYYASHQLYPDANSTMRLSIGTVKGYSPADGKEFNYFTTTNGVLQKARNHAEDPDFQLSSEFISILKEANQSPLADKDHRMHVNFITNNDITGGNSGSPVFNAKGQLLGLAFDGNWEAMSSDIHFEPQLQRCIAVDVRYLLYIIHQAKADRILQELGLPDDSTIH